MHTYVLLEVVCIGIDFDLRRLEVFQKNSHKFLRRNKNLEMKVKRHRHEQLIRACTEMISLLLDC